MVLLLSVCSGISETESASVSPSPAPSSHFGGPRQSEGPSVFWVLVPATAVEPPAPGYGLREASLCRVTVSETSEVGLQAKHTPGAMVSQ